MASIFSIENVKFPSLVTMSTDFTIDGELKLFSLPFYGVMWVVAKVTYPKQWWEIIGSPITTQTVIATLGKFSITFPKGFDREGDYLLDIAAYLGPEKTESAGPVTSVSVEIPPFPAMASTKQATFTVSGTGPVPSPISFSMSNPTINPSTVEIGKQTVITLPVKNIGTQAQTITVELQITEMGWSDIAPPGSIVGDQTFGPYTLQPGDTQNVVYNWTAAGAATGKWIVASIFINKVLTPNTGPNNPEIFKQQFEVISPVVSFQLLNPVLVPADVELGKVTQITFDVVNNSTDPQTVNLHADITEMGWSDIAPPGSIVDSQDFGPQTIQPGAHWNPVWNWTAKGAITGKWIVLSLKDNSGNLTPNTGPNNPNIFKQEFQVVAPVVSYQLLNPVLAPADVVFGQVVQITFDVVNNSTDPQTVNLHADITEMGWSNIAPPGSIVDSKDFGPQTIQPGTHWNPVWNWTAKGAITGKWIVLSLKDSTGTLTPNTGPNNPNIFKQEFQILAATTPTLTVTPTTVNSGGTVSFTFTNFKASAMVTITGSFSSTPITVTANASGAGSGSFAAVGPAGLQTLTATDGTNTAHAQFTITVSPTLTVSPTSIKTGDSLTYTYSNFAKNAAITVQIVASDSTIISAGTSQSDANGSGSGGLKISGTPGLYSLMLSDASGNLTSAQFTLTENITGLVVSYSGTIPKLAVGYGLQCAATITNADGTTQDVTQNTFTVWLSSNPAVATVDNKGSVTGVGVGTVTITAKYTEPIGRVALTGTVNLQVVATPGEANEPTPYALNIKPTSPANLTVAFNQQFDAYIQYNQSDMIIYHDNTDVHWQSSNPAVATVSAYGMVSGVSAGTTQIFCVYGGVSSNKVTLTVVAGASTANASGQVVDAVTQAGIAGVTVQIGSVQVDTDSGGNWTMANVPVGPQTITYSLTGYVTQMVNGWTIQPGVNNNIGSMTLCRITGNLITLLSSGVTADYWNLLLKDTNGKTISIMYVPLSAMQKVYLPDSFAFPANFMITAFKYIGVNNVAQVVDWQSIFSTLPNYVTTRFTGLGTYVMNLSIGVLTKTG
jgi:hypothetical protein